MLSLFVKWTIQLSLRTLEALFVCLTDWTTLIKGMLLLSVGLKKFEKNEINLSNKQRLK